MWTILYELLEDLLFDILLSYPFVILGIFLLDLVKLKFSQNKNIKDNNSYFYKKRFVIKRLLKKQFKLLLNKK
jgi:hypothetical protein